MEISWLGHSCTRVRTKQATVVLDPYQREGSLDMGRPNADIVTISHDDPRHAHVAGVRGQPLVIAAPGEYEVQGVLIVGIPASARGTDPSSRNIAYLIEAEGLHVAQLGAAGAPAASQASEILSNVDILLLPIGEDGLDPDAAAHTVRALEPRIAIPVGYDVPGSGQDARLKAFLSAVGINPEQPVARFSIAGHAGGEAQRVVLLEPRT